MSNFIFSSPPHFLFRSAATVFFRLSNESMFSGSSTGSVTVSGTTACVTIGTTAICLAQWPSSTLTLSICFVTTMGRIASAMTLPAVGHCAQ